MLMLNNNNNNNNNNVLTLKVKGLFDIIKTFGDGGGESSNGIKI